MALDNFVLQNTNPLEAYLQGAGGIQTLQNNQQVMDLRRQQMEQAQQAQVVAQQQAEAAQAAAIRKQQMQVDLYNTTDPQMLARKTSAYQLAYPDDYKAVEASSKTLNDAQRKNLQGITAQVTSSVASGRNELGQDVLDKYVESLRNSGAPDDQIAGAEFFRKQYSHDPKAAVMAMNLGSRALDPSSYDTNNKVEADTAAVLGKEAREADLYPLEKQAKQAGIQLTQAQTIASGAGVINELARLKLDKLKEAQAANNVQLSDGAMKVQAAYIDGATTARSSASTAESLANGFLTLNPLSAKAGDIAEWTKRLTGNSDEISNMRKNYILFKNQGALTMLPPGAASENDMKRVLEGFPDENTKPQTMAKYLQSYAKVQKDIANAAELKAEWISANGNLGRTTRDITMGEMIVPKGTTFSRFLPLAMKNASKASAVASTGVDPTSKYAKYIK